MPRNYPDFLASLGVLILAATISACANTPTMPTDDPITAEATSEHPIVAASPTRRSPTATATTSPTATETLIPSATPTLTPVPYNYSAMQEELATYIMYATARESYDLGVAFIDLQTGQVIHVNGEMRFHAMSTFKGPLAAYYWWLVEQGEIEPTEADLKHMQPMLEWSSNVDTTCIFKRVGGIEGFNDWLADQGLSREKNFVFKWELWQCPEDGENYVPEYDWRYSKGDEALGLPGDAELLGCPIRQIPCDKAFAPVEIAEFYAKLYRGEIINQEHLDVLLPLMEEGENETVFIGELPPNTDVTVYSKSGTYQSDATYRENFIGEAGIVVTPRGAFILAIYMQQNPEWPGTWPMSESARIIYEHFMAAHAP